MPSCGQTDMALVPLKNFSLIDGEEKMLIQLTAAIIPKKNFIGATDTKAHEFTLMMADGCYEPEKQKRFTTGLKEFDQLAKNKYESSFTACTPDLRDAWLNTNCNKCYVTGKITHRFVNGQW